MAKNFCREKGDSNEHEEYYFESYFDDETIQSSLRKFCRFEKAEY